MESIGKGALSRYVRAKMRGRGLTQREVELRSGGKITDGYVADILSGAARNPSVEKIAALAVGLGVDMHEIFDIASRPFRQDVDEQHTANGLQILPFLEMVLTIAESPDLIRILEEIVKLLPEERKIILDSLEAINQHKVRQLTSKTPLLHHKKNA